MSQPYRLQIIGMFLIGTSTVSAQSQSLERDIAFVPNGGNEQQLDLYLPGTAGFPTVLFVHEGSLTSGDRKDEPYAQMCQAFVSLEIACASTNYRLAPEFEWPAQPRDIVAAFGWLKRNVSRWGGDPARIFLFGHSSGCLIVSSVGADSRYLVAEGWSPEDVAGIIAMGCRLNDVLHVTSERPRDYETSWVSPEGLEARLARDPAFTTLEARNSAVPASHVTEALPPTLVLVAEDERFFPPILRDGSEFVGRALAAGAEAELAILHDRRHMTAIQMMVTPDDPAMLLVSAFVRSH